MARHPGFYIKEEMEERGITERDLSWMLSIPEESLNDILSGKNGIGHCMAHILAEYFDVPAEFFINIQKSYESTRTE